MRECSVCQLPMTSGFVVHGGEAYFCSVECLPFTDEEWEEMYDDGNSDSYWTEWEEKVIPMKEFSDDFTCACGNDVSDSGFHTCDAKGKEIEPNVGEWEGHYVCGRCDQVYLPVEEGSEK